jgi:hypothetical protein
MLKIQSTKNAGGHRRTFSRTETIARLLVRQEGLQLVINELRHRTKKHTLRRTGDRTPNRICKPRSRNRSKPYSVND